jgi:Pyridine nucleotide-disulphide oxidoreductase, dimerisation domain
MNVNSPAASAPRSSKSSTSSSLAPAYETTKQLSADFDPVTIASQADDHKAYYPGSHPVQMRYTADRDTGRLLGLQLLGHLGSEIAKRVDIAATAIHNVMTIDEMSELDLSYTPPLGSPWDTVQIGAQVWERAVRTTAVS